MSHKEESIANTDNSKLKEKIVPIVTNIGISVVFGLLIGPLVYLIYSSSIFSSQNVNTGILLDNTNSDQSPVQPNTGTQNILGKLDEDKQLTTK